MTTTLGASAAVDSALRRAFSEASVRVAPDARITDIVAALGAMGVTIELQDGVLVMAQSGTEMHTVKALRSFAARPEHAKFFVLVTHDPKTWSQQQKIEYLRTHTADEYGRLCHEPVLEAGIKTLDANLSRRDFKNLTTKEKVAFISEYGDAGVRMVMAKKA